MRMRSALLSLFGAVFSGTGVEAPHEVPDRSSRWGFPARHAWVASFLLSVKPQDQASDATQV